MDNGVGTVYIVQNMKTGQSFTGFNTDPKFCLQDLKDRLKTRRCLNWKLQDNWNKYYTNSEPTCFSFIIVRNCVIEDVLQSTQSST